MSFKPELFANDLKIAFRSLARAKGLAITVVLTLALGIGANAAIFSLVRGVLLRPLVNADENHLIYIRQSAPGLGVENSNFSVPELRDIESSVHSISEFGDFSTIGFTMIGLGEPREVRAGVVGGSYFHVMGLHPVLGRLIGPQDDGPNAAGVAVLTYRFWSTTLKSDPTVIGKNLRLGSFGARTATIIGVLEPSVPYPADTEIIANIVTSPHHLSATMVEGRVHRMTELFGRLAPGVTIEQARAELRTVYGSMVSQHSADYAKTGGLPNQCETPPRTNHLRRTYCPSRFAGSFWSHFHHRVFERRQSDSWHDPSAAKGNSPSARHSAPPRARFAGLYLRKVSFFASSGATLGVITARPLLAVLARYASRFSVRALDLTVDCEHVVGRCAPRRHLRCTPGVCAAPSECQYLANSGSYQRRRPHYRQRQPAPAHLRRCANCCLLHAARRRQHASENAPCDASRADRPGHAPRPCYQRSRYFLRKNA